MGVHMIYSNFALHRQVQIQTYSTILGEDSFDTGRGIWEAA
jgi:hypothetical protein